MLHRPRVLLIASVATLCLVATATADRVRLVNGRVLEGEARELAGGEVEIVSAMGTLRIPAEMVAAVEVAETREEQIERLLRERPALSVDELYELSRQSRLEGAATLARRLLWRLLERDPDHEGARRALGFRNLDGRWVTEEEWHQLHGEVRFRGEWMTREDRARILELEAYRAQIAEQRRLESERRMWEERQRLEALEGGRRGTSGIPYEWVWTPSAGVVLPPAFVPLPESPSPAPRPTPPPRASEPPPSPSPPAGRANRSRFLRPPGS